MKPHRFPRFVAAGVLALTTACEAGEPLPLAPARQPAGAQIQAAARSINPVFSIPDLAEVGTSTIVRTPGGVSYHLSTVGLESGTAATLWFIVFNRPEHCAGSPCQESDLGDPAVRGDVIHAAGRVIAGGSTTFAGQTRTGDAAGSLFGALGLPAPGLEAPRTAEIHLVVRTHGPVIRGMIPDMMHTFNGGCGHPGAGFPDPLPPELGASGPNTCAGVRFSIHLP